MKSLSVNDVIILSGLILLLALPAGVFSGVNSTLFSLIVCCHLATLLFALFLGLEDWAGIFKESTVSKALAGCAALFFISLMVVRGLLPVTAKDALVHHLAVPRLWLEAGAISPVFWHEWSFYPMLPQLAYTAFLRFGLEQFTSLYHMVWLLLLSLTAGSYTNRLLKNADFALCTSLLCLSIPICINLGSTPLVDLPLAVFTLTGLIELSNGVEKKESFPFMLGGAALGLSLGCKPNAMLACALLIPVSAAAARKFGATYAQMFKWTLTALVALGLTYLPWLIKNFAWTGDPFYPMFKGWFEIPAAIETYKSTAGLTPLLQRVLLYGEPLWQVALLPARIFLTGEDGNPALFDGRLSPVLILFVLSFPFLKKHPFLFTGCLFSLFYLLFALVLTSARIRYLAPVYGPLCILSLTGLFYSLSALSEYRRKLVLILVLGAHLFVSSLYAINLFGQSGAVFYFFGDSSETKESYLERFIPEYPLLDYINQETPSDSKVFLLFTGNRYYYIDRAIASSGYMSGNALFTWLKSCEDGACLANELKRRGITHILAHTERTVRTLSDSLDEKDKRVWNEFQAGFVEMLAYKNSYVLWAVLPVNGYQK